MAGAGCTMGASAFSGMGLVLSGRGNEDGLEGSDVGGGAVAGG
jgi:hypothetical protein